MQRDQRLVRATIPSPSHYYHDITTQEYLELGSTMTTRYLSSEEDSSQQEGEEDCLHGVGGGLVAALFSAEEEPALTGVTADCHH